MKKLIIKLESKLTSDYEVGYVEITNINDVDFAKENYFESNEEETVYFEKNNNIRKAQRKAFLNQ